MCAVCEGGTKSSTGLSPCEICPKQGDAAAFTVLFAVAILGVVAAMSLFVVRSDQPLYAQLEREDRMAIMWDNEEAIEDMDMVAFSREEVVKRAIRKESLREKGIAENTKVVVCCLLRCISVHTLACFRLAFPFVCLVDCRVERRQPESAHLGPSQM